LPRILFFRPHPIPVRHAISEPRLYALRMLQLLLNGLLAMVYFVTISYVLFIVGEAIWDVATPRYPDTINLQPSG
jgi:type IV secretory pathway TrbD component